jgi:hypothetical protein
MNTAFINLKKTESGCIVMGNEAPNNFIPVSETKTLQ